MGFVTLHKHCHSQAYGLRVTMSSCVTNLHVSQPTLQQLIIGGCLSLTHVFTGPVFVRKEHALHCQLIIFLMPINHEPPNYGNIYKFGLLLSHEHKYSISTTSIVALSGDCLLRNRSYLASTPKTSSASLSQSNCLVFRVTDR